MTLDVYRGHKTTIQPTKSFKANVDHFEEERQIVNE